MKLYPVIISIIIVLGLGLGFGAVVQFKPPQSNSLGLSDRQASNACFIRALVRMKNSDSKGAIDEYDQALRINPKDSSAYVGRGINRAALGDSAGCLEDYNKAIELNPHYTDAYFNRSVEEEAMGDRKGAIADLTMVINLDPHFYGAYIGRESLRTEIGDVRGANEDREYLTATRSQAEAEFSWKSAILACRAGHMSDAAGFASRWLLSSSNDLSQSLNKKINSLK